MSTDAKPALSGDALALLDSTPTPLPPPREAANARSPNRQARSAGLLQRWERENAGRFFLFIFRVTGDEAMALERVERTKRTLTEWRSKDAAFKEAHDHLVDMWEDIHAGRIEGLVGKAVDVFEFFMKNPAEYPTQAAQAASKLLSGLDVLKNKSSVEHSAPGGGPVQIETKYIPRVTIHGPEPKQLVEGESRDLPDEVEDDDSDTDEV